MWKYVAIGDDGRRPVVWGMGATEEEALDDGRLMIRECAASAGDAAQALRTASVESAVAARIEAGNVDASDL